MIADVADVIPTEHHATLRKAGVLNTAQLYERVVKRRSRRSLSIATGIRTRTLSEWARFLDLMQLNGIGPKMVRLLNAAGVETLRDLARADAASLQPKMRAVNGAGRFSEVVPPLGVVRSWIQQAGQVEPRLE